jgi:hypothetical protein
VHWDAAYAEGDDTRSWFEEYPGMSLRMLDSAGVSAADALIDIGGGASPLTRALLDRGFRCTELIAHARNVDLVTSSCSQVSIPMTHLTGPT